jgi:hypothetical protein
VTQLDIDALPEPARTKLIGERRFALNIYGQRLGAPRREYWSEKIRSAASDDPLLPFYAEYRDENGGATTGNGSVEKGVLELPRLSARPNGSDAAQPVRSAEPEVTPPIQRPIETPPLADQPVEKKKRGRKTVTGLTPVAPLGKSLRYGSDVEIAARVAGDLMLSYGDVLYDDGDFYRYNRSCWTVIDDTYLRRSVHQYDGASYMTPAATEQVVKLTKTRIDSILYEMRHILSRGDFFRQAMHGICCLSGFITFASDGTPSQTAHHADQRARHVLQANWFAKPKRYSAIRLVALQTVERMLRGRR